MYPLVSICCLTYNHEPYIRQCIEGFRMQITNFPIEILIHDDASTDGTAKIIMEYEKKYPDIIKPIYQKENQYSQLRTISATYQFPRALGKYIAICEGDDYWTDPYKLQIQVDFLEENPDYTLIHSDFNTINLNGSITKDTYREKKQHHDFQYFTRDALLGKYLIATCTVCALSIYVKKALKEYPELFDSRWVTGDFQLWYILATFGKIKYLNQSLAAYRVLSGSVAHPVTFDKKYMYIQNKHKLLLFLNKKFINDPSVENLVSRIYINSLLKLAFDFKNRIALKRALKCSKAINYNFTLREYLLAMGSLGGFYSLISKVLLRIFKFKLSSKLICLINYLF
ncbi:MAG: glycosyltransferase [Bacteroidales bacterium]|nr:glycosyltransferase [Bacteroidales bacterium]